MLWILKKKLDHSSTSSLWPIKNHIIAYNLKLINYRLSSANVKEALPWINSIKRPNIFAQRYTALPLTVKLNFNNGGQVTSFYE